MFNETQSRIIISLKKQNASAALALLEWRGVPARRLGAVTKSDSLRISADGKTFVLVAYRSQTRPGRDRLRSSSAEKSHMIRSISAALFLAASSLWGADSTSTAASAINDLAIDLLVQAAKPQENTALSPYSIQVALAMTYAGAQGETRQQMARVLHYPTNGSNVPRSFSELQDALAELTKRTEKIATQSKKSGGPSEPITLTVANRLFGQRGYDFRPAYLSLLKDTFHAPLETLDFMKNPGRRRETHQYLGSHSNPGKDPRPHSSQRAQQGYATRSRQCGLFKSPLGQ